MRAYRITLFEKAEHGPYGVTSDEQWYNYTISNGNNSIAGCRSGKQAEVRAYLNEIVQRMNRNLDIKPGRKTKKNTIPRPCFIGESHAIGY